MILSEDEDVIVKDLISGKYCGQGKSSNLKRLSTFMNKVKSANTSIEVLLNDLSTLDISKFLKDIIDVILAECKTSDAAKLFILYTQISKEYPEAHMLFIEHMRTYIKDKMESSKLKLLLKFCFICTEYNVDVHSELVIPLYNIISKLQSNDMLTILAFIHKYISQCTKHLSITGTLYLHFEAYLRNLESKIPTLIKQINAQLGRLRSTFENRGDISSTANSEFLSLFNEMDMLISIFTKLGGDKSQLPTVDMQNIIIEDGVRIRFHSDGLSNEFDSIDEEKFYTEFLPVEISDVSSIFREDLCVKKLLDMNSMEDSDIAYWYFKQGLKEDVMTLAECILKCCRLSNHKISLICRVIARLAQDSSIFSEIIRDSVFSHASSLIRMSNIVAGLRYRVCTVLCELTKFGIFDVGSLYRYIFMCCDSFDSNAVEMICIILENCGRFLSSRKDDKRLDNLVRKLHTKVRETSRPSNYYKIIHILSFFENNELSLSATTEFDSLLCIDEIFQRYETSLDHFHSIICIFPYIEFITDVQFTALCKAISGMTSHEKTCFLEYFFVYFTHLIEMGTVQACFSLLKLFAVLCPDTFSHEVLLSFFIESIFSNCIDMNDSNSLISLSTVIFSNIFQNSSCESEAKNVFFGTGESETKSGLSGTVPHSNLTNVHQQQQKNSNESSSETVLFDKEFDSVYSSTIKTELSYCLTKRPIKARVPSHSLLKGERLHNGLLMITSQKKKTRDLL